LLFFLIKKEANRIHFKPSHMFRQAQHDNAQKIPPTTNN
jgi:hypothetical protein